MLLIVVSIIIGLLILAALISATETAITAASPGKLHQLKNEGSHRATAVLTILKIKDRVISTLLIGNSIANTICTTLAASVFIELLGDDMGTIISSIVMSFVIIVFSEVIPKAIAVAKPEKLALFAIPALKVLLVILRPINIMLFYIVKLFCFIFRIDLKPELSGADEVRGVIQHHTQEGNVYKDDSDMLEGILDIRTMIVSDIMVHRSNIFAIDIDLPVTEIAKQSLESVHTRIPVWQKNRDNIIGVLHIRDLLQTIYDDKDNIDKINVRNLLSDPWFVPENASVIKQLHAFREKQSHIAFVVSEYGDLFGIITLEDILEEIVGQIDDELDIGNNKIVRKSATEFLIDGSVSIRDLNREFNWNLPENEATTIAGFIIHEVERIPNQGEFITYKNLKLLVKKKAANKIKTIKVNILEIKEDVSDK
ncbi:MAG: HlyC/CorC family transporter [Rickettsiaceae bacterium]|nr:HlyC/CorC family transporter [Rickettsiaceae bacterium]